MLIAQISDSHLMAPDPSDVASLKRVRDLAAVVDALNKMDPRPEVVIHTGDVAHRGKTEQYDMAVGILQRLEIPIFFAAGNRDDRELMQQHLGALSAIGTAHGYLHYSVEGFPLRLVALDSKSDTGNLGDLTAGQLQALEVTLDEAPDTPTAIFMHHPPFDVTGAKEPFQFESREPVSWLETILENRPQVVRVFCGHAHRDFRTTLAGIAASTTPCVASDLAKGDAPPEQAGKALFSLHTWDGAGFTTQIIAVG